MDDKTREEFEVKDEKINQDVKSLIEWCKSRKLTPQDVAPAALRLLAEQAVANMQVNGKGDDLNTMNDFIAKVANFFAFEVQRAAGQDYARDEPELGS
jgi:hypothetical protein